MKLHKEIKTVMGYAQLTPYGINHYDKDGNPTSLFVIQDISSGSILVKNMKDVLGIINSDRSSSWREYTIADWQDGWYEWIEGNDYIMLGEIG